MMSFQSIFARRALLVLALVGIGDLPAQRTSRRGPISGTPVGFIERFALADNRAEVLRELVPGSKDHYFFRCLERQHVGDTRTVEQLLAEWIKRYGADSRVREIQHRQALLLYGERPESTRNYLIRHLGVQLNHQRQRKGAAPELPTVLDQGLLAPGQLVRKALQRYPRNVRGLAPEALWRLGSVQLNADQLGALLEQLPEPDFPNLAALCVRDLPRPDAFGSRKIHGRLTLAQLEECAQLMPALLRVPNFVNAWLGHLVPGPDVDWRTDAASRLAYLERLQGFVGRLDPVFNSLKAHVLYHRLHHDLADGKVDPQRLLSYLRLPRPVGYAPRRLAQNAGPRRVTLTATYPTGLPAIGNDEPLVRECLSRRMVDADSTRTWAPFVREDWLQRVLVETKLLNGVGAAADWVGRIKDPAWFEQLRQRVELRFPATRKERFGVDDAVSIDVEVKNVDKLLIKVFEIDAFNYCVGEGKDVDASIALDGLVANEERELALDADPLRRVRRTFEFPQLRGAGVWVVEFLGNGIASRTIVRKGGLRTVSRQGGAGHVFRVHDLAGNHLKDASAWFGGREYPADQDGEILIPYSTKGGMKRLVVRHGRLASTESFRHASERYRLRAHVHVQREALLPGRTAQVLVRPSLTLSGVHVDPALLQRVVLQIRATDQDGVVANLDVRNLKLERGAELVHSFRVPPNLARLSVSLAGEAESLTTGKPVAVRSQAHQVLVNGIDATPGIESFVLGRTRAGYVADLLGKDGEPSANKAVQVTLTMRDFREKVSATLRTDDAGRVRLGALVGVRAVRLSHPTARTVDWDLSPRGFHLPSSVVRVAGQPVQIAYPAPLPGGVRRAQFSLFEMRGKNVFQRDVLSALSIRDGYLSLQGLPAGSYRLGLRALRRSVSIEVVAGRQAGWAVVGGTRWLASAPGQPAQVTSVRIVGDDIEVRTASVGPQARVHVAATRYVQPFELHASLAAARHTMVSIGSAPYAQTSYHAGREIGDEYRYILERRSARKFPGNMLERPGRLLNPWALTATETAVGVGGGGGGRFRGRRGGRAAGGPSSPAAQQPKSSNAPGAWTNFAFLPEAARMLSNLRPDENGVVRIPRAALGGKHHVHVVVIDSTSSAHGELVLDETPLIARPTRLLGGLDPTRPLSEQRRVEFVAADGRAVIEDFATAKMVTLDSLASVYELFRTLSNNADLAKFDFVTRWNALDAEAKREKYSEHACHELHLFVYMKDRAFFDTVVKPYLANKTDRTFIDRWLLEEDLSEFLKPWAFQRLNIVEQILLAQRAGDARGGVVRSIEDRVAQLPVDPVEQARIFRGVLGSDALEVDTALGVRLEGLAERNAAKPGTSRVMAPGRAGRPMLRAAKKMAGLQSPAADAEEVEEEVEDSSVLTERDAAKDIARREQVRRLYQAPLATQRYVEQHYWRVPMAQDVASRIGPNPFWRDYALRPAGQPFLSDHLARATGSFSEMMLALSVLDLPFEPGKHETQQDDRKLTIRAATPLLLVRQDLAAAEPATADDGAVLVSQNVFRLAERYRVINGERRDAWVSQEFLTGVAYGCQVVVTNPTSSARSLEVLLQVPQGAVPVRKGFETRSLPMRLNAYSTQAIDYAFYFPRTGDYRHYPVTVATEGRLLARGEPMTFKVVDEPTIVDTASWSYISQTADNDAVLEFLATGNVREVDLKQIAWRMKDRAVFGAALQRLRSRHVFDATLWGYGYRHGDERAMREHLRHQEAFLRACGPVLSSPLVTIDPVERRWYEHVEYRPLINPRAHRFGDQRRILNGNFAGHYQRFLGALAHTAKRASADWLDATYYLLLQDRIEEALAAFDRVDPSQLQTGLQYDAMKAYLAFYRADIPTARSIASKHRDHPVTRWRTMFRTMLAHLDEANSVGNGGGDGPGQPGDLAKTEPALELAVESGKISLGYRNIDRCELRFFKMDVEFLFSTRPFVEQDGGAFAYVRPNRVDAVVLPGDLVQLTRELPAEYRNANVLVEARAAGIVRRVPVYQNSMAIQWIESRGQLRVADPKTGKPLAKVYVKVFGRQPDGSVRFHKDGYTDLRGRFDYVSMSGSNAMNAKRYAVLVLSEDRGAAIREAAPPVR